MTTQSPISPKSCSCKAPKPCKHERYAAGPAKPEPKITSTEALAGLLLVLGVEMTGGSAMDATILHELTAALPAARELGLTSCHDWRVDVLLRNLYLALSPEHRALVDGDALGFPTPLWEMMTGEIVSL